MRIDKNLKVNTKAFLEIVSEMFSEWIPDLAGVGIQAVWAGYYTEPRYIVDPELPGCMSTNCWDVLYRNILKN